MSNIFDDLTTGTNQNNGIDTQEPTSEKNLLPEQTLSAQYTSNNIKTATQELLKFGLLEAERKPNIYQTTATHRDTINGILEPLDLFLEVDDIRGLAFVVTTEQLFLDKKSNKDSSQEDAWSHPLVRRQRLTLEQTLLVAILRQHYVVHEQEAGIGAGGAVVALEELLPQLTMYIGDSGSESRDQKRLRNLLDNLKAHGIVSDIDSKDDVSIRPIITHLANPETLQTLLRSFIQLTKTSDDKNSHENTK